MIARSLNQQTTTIIALVVRNFSTHFYIESIRLFTQYFQHHGYSIMLFNVDAPEEGENRLFQALEYQVAGLVITSATLTSPFVERCLNYSTPVFLFNRVSEGHKVNSVSCDNFYGGEQVAEYLIKKGHKSLVYISGESGSSTNRDRQSGFIRRATELGIKSIRIVQGDFSYRSGYAAARELLTRDPDFDGIFCAADPMAKGFLDYVNKETNYSIPRDFSLVGFDGITLPNEDDYPLTTYHQPLKRMVEKTVQLMLQKIDNYSPDPVSYLFNGEILELGTVRDRSGG